MGGVADKVGGGLGQVHPDDPNYLIGTYYIAIYCTASDCEFEITAKAGHPRPRASLPHRLRPHASPWAEATALAASAHTKRDCSSPPRHATAGGN